MGNRERRGKSHFSSHVTGILPVSCYKMLHKAPLKISSGVVRMSGYVGMCDVSVSVARRNVNRRHFVLTGLANCWLGNTQLTINTLGLHTCSHNQNNIDTPQVGKCYIQTKVLFEILTQDMLYQPVSN